MRKQRTFIRLMALLLLLPVLLTAACSFAAMAEGEVILEDRALIGDLEDAMTDLVMESETSTVATDGTVMTSYHLRSKTDVELLAERVTSVEETTDILTMDALTGGETV